MSLMRREAPGSLYANERFTWAIMSCVDSVSSVCVSADTRGDSISVFDRCGVGIVAKPIWEADDATQDA